MTKSVIIGFDQDNDDPTKAVLVVGSGFESTNEKTKILNAFENEDAIELWKKLTER